MSLMAMSLPPCPPPRLPVLLLSSSIPGPGMYAAVSSQCKTIHALFQAYGQSRLCDLGAMKSVYSTWKFDKSDYYKSLLTNDNDHAMTTLPNVQHSIRRKAYASHYTPQQVGFWRPRTLDCGIGELPKRGILRSTVPTWAWNLVCKIPNARLRLLCDSDKIMAEFVSTRVYEMRAQLNAGKYPSGETMPDHDVISECMGHMVAGSDTTSISLSYFLWELTRRQDILRKLQNEIDAAMPDPNAIPDIKILNGLEYLNAFIKEGLRLYGAAPSLLERVVPVSTSKNFFGAEGFDLMGYALPPGTIVGTQSWSLHRDPAVFPSPETFLPERWLPSYAASKEGTAEDMERDAARLARMASHMMPFGTGSRICGGLNLAHIIMRVVLVAVLRNFEVEAAPGTDEKSMDMRDSFVMFPAAMECKLLFHPRALA
ncbi:cytochrome P450 [Mycena leptocephala]|nr:cytochrome P450 [Mycena leptocephala]